MEETPPQKPEVGFVSGSADLSDRLAEARERRADKAQDMGMLGHFLGSKDSTPTNVAGLVVILLACLLAAILFIPLNGDISKSQALQMVGGFFLAALGYLFGSISGGKNK